MSFEIYLCPVCGDTIKWPLPATSWPNTIHEHIIDGQQMMVKMIKVWPQEKREEKKANDN